MHISAVQAGDTHPAAADQIDAELIAQAINLLCAQAGIAEHTALLQQVVKVFTWQCGVQHIDQRLTHLQDA